MKWIDGMDLVQWANRRDRQALLPEVVLQLVYATVPDARRVEFRFARFALRVHWKAC